MSTTAIPEHENGTRRRGRGRPLLYGEPTIRRSVDIPESLHTLLQRKVAEENFKAGRTVTSQAQLIVDLLYDSFGLDNPVNG